MNARPVWLDVNFRRKLSINFPVSYCPSTIWMMQGSFQVVFHRRGFRRRTCWQNILYGILLKGTNLMEMIENERFSPCRFAVDNFRPSYEWPCWISIMKKWFFQNKIFGPFLPQCTECTGDRFCSWKVVSVRCLAMEWSYEFWLWILVNMSS